MDVQYTVVYFSLGISNSLPSLSFLYASEDIEKVFKDEIFRQRFPRGKSVCMKIKGNIRDSHIMSSLDCMLDKFNR